MSKIARLRAVKPWGLVLAGLLCLAAALPAQTGSEVSTSEVSTGLLGLNPLGAHPGGLHLYSTTVFGGYYSGGIPTGFAGVSAGAYAGSSGMAGGSANMGWVHSTERMRFAVSYGASYTSQFSYSSLSGLSQSMGFQASRSLSAKWSWSLVASAGTSMAQQSLLAPTPLGNLVTVPSTFDALSLVASTTDLNSGQIASLLTGAPVLASPAQTLLYGSKFFFSSAQTSVTYAHSSRLSISGSIGAGLTEHLADQARDAVYPYILPQTKSISGTLSLSYSLSPRTSLSASVSESRSVSSLLDSYNTYGNVTLTRNMGRHWFLSGNIGVGTIRTVKTTYSLPQGPQFIGGGSIGYKLWGSTLMASYQRLMGDMYGLGAESTLNLTGAWGWNRPGTSWGLTVSGGYQVMQFATISRVNSWRASGGLTRRLNPHMSLQLTYGFASYSGYQGSLYSGTQNAVQAALVWTPRPGF